jgi:NADPH:quinone reductase
MRSVIYDAAADPPEMRIEERPPAEPQAGEVRIRVAVSGVNPTDWKARRNVMGRSVAGDVVPNHDGGGVVDAIGPGVDRFAPGDRVWWTLSGHENPFGGTAQDYTVVPVERVFALPDQASFDLGASVGIPAITAHRALAVAEDGPTRLRPDSLSGRTVLVAGGAGGVGNAAIQLARWAGATVIATVSNDEKARLAKAAGADHVILYKTEDVAQRVRELAPEGVDTVVEVAPGTNLATDLAVLKTRGNISIYANDGGGDVAFDIFQNNPLNARYQFILLYTIGNEAIEAAGEAISEAIADGAFGVGEESGLPLHHFPLDDTAAAHDAVEKGAVGKVLIQVS